VTEALEPAPIGSARPGQHALLRGVGVALASLPIILTVVLAAVTPGFLDPIFDVPPAILGVPAGVVLVIAPLVWALLGMLVARSAHTSNRTTLALVAFTVPASIGIVLWWAVIQEIRALS
jgi:hypothetical protein